MSIENNYIENVQQLFAQYKSLAEKAMTQVEDKRLFWEFNNESNSIAKLVQHLNGNMLSRFTNFYEEDGEKPWRDRDTEFETLLTTRLELNEAWEKGWQCFFNILNNLKENDLMNTVVIRGEKHTVVQALNRQLAHYSYHIGQIVFLAKMLNETGWHSLSIPKNKSVEFNEKMMMKP
ncbi:MAG: DUF1572 family protein [Flavobacteriales bacterium]